MTPPLTYPTLSTNQIRREPIGVCAAIAATVGGRGLAILFILGKLILLMYVGLLIFVVPDTFELRYRITMVCLIGLGIAGFGLATMVSNCNPRMSAKRR